MYIQTTGFAGSAPLLLYCGGKAFGKSTQHAGKHRHRLLLEQATLLSFSNNMLGCSAHEKLHEKVSYVQQYAVITDYLYYNLPCATLLREQAAHASCLRHFHAKKSTGKSATDNKNGRRYSDVYVQVMRTWGLDYTGSASCACTVQEQASCCRVVRGAADRLEGKNERWYRYPKRDSSQGRDTHMMHEFEQQCSLPYGADTKLISREWLLLCHVFCSIAGVMVLQDDVLVYQCVTPPIAPRCCCV